MRQVTPGVIILDVPTPSCHNTNVRSSSQQTQTPVANPAGVFLVDTDGAIRHEKHDNYEFKDI